MPIHNLQPIYNQYSKILILGSFPSVSSRENFYHHHPQNRFWRILFNIFCSKELQSREDKIEFLLKEHIALWDVIRSCDIKNSSDLSIKNATPNNLFKIINHACVERIFLNGKSAQKVYQQYFSINIPTFVLPSTSPANAKYSFEKLLNEWKIIKE